MAVQTPDAANRGQRSELAFVLSIIGGIIMVAGSTFFMYISYSGGLFHYGMIRGFGFGREYPYMMGGYGVGYGFPQFVFGEAIVGIISGIIVLISAILLLSTRNNRRACGVLILIFSVVGLIGIGGYYIGPLLGIIGGVLVLSRS